LQSPRRPNHSVFPYPPLFRPDGVPETTQLPRLTRLQYDNTIRDLVGIEGDFSSMLAPDSTGGVDARAWDGYQAAAKAVSEQAMADRKSTRLNSSHVKISYAVF